VSENFERKSIDVEGPDQVGKGDAVKNIAQEYCNQGIDSTIISFPYYATPIGYSIREVLTEGFSSEIGIENSREVKVKMALFALNRLEILNSILSTKQRGIYIFDRGPFSNALTIAHYLVNEDSSQVNVDDLVDTAIDLDRYFRKVLNIDNCIIKLQTEEDVWVPNRGERGDLYENSDVQEKSKYVYSKFEERIGPGWINITTKKPEGWRNRKEIREDCVAFASTRLGIYGKRYRAKPNPKYIGIKSVQEDLYLGSEVDLKMRKDWLNAVKSNNKEEIYSLGQVIAIHVAKSVDRIEWCNRDIRNEVKRIMELNPEVLDVLEYMYGEKFIINFLQSIYE